MTLFHVTTAVAVIILFGCENSRWEGGGAEIPASPRPPSLFKPPAFSKYNYVGA